MKNNKGYVDLEVIIVTGIVLFFMLFFSMFLWPFGWSQGYGNHTGFVTAVDLKGNIWKNYDVFFKTDNQSSQEDVYCVSINNPILANQLLEESKKRRLITINYHTMWYFNTYGKCGGDIIDSFDVIEEVKNDKKTI